MKPVKDYLHIYPVALCLRCHAQHAFGLHGWLSEGMWKKVYYCLGCGEATPSVSPVGYASEADLDEWDERCNL